jgi:hypothetical protein
MGILYTVDDSNGAGVPVPGLSERVARRGHFPENVKPRREPPAPRLLILKCPVTSRAVVRKSTESKKQEASKAAKSKPEQPWGYF